MKVRVGKGRGGFFFREGEILELLEDQGNGLLKIKLGNGSVDSFSCERFEVVPEGMTVVHDSVLVEGTSTVRIQSNMPQHASLPHPGEDPSAKRDREHMPAPVQGPTPYDHFPDLAAWACTSGAVPGRDRVEGLKGGHALQRCASLEPPWVK